MPCVLRVRRVKLLYAQKYRSSSLNSWSAINLPALRIHRTSSARSLLHRPQEYRAPLTTTWRIGRPVKNHKAAKLFLCRRPDIVAEESLLLPANAFEFLSGFLLFGGLFYCHELS